MSHYTTTLPTDYSRPRFFTKKKKDKAVFHCIYTLLFRMTTSFFALDYLRYLGFLRATAPATFDFAALLKLSDTLFFSVGNLVLFVFFRPR